MEPGSVLVVDDDFPMRAMLASALREEGYRVEVQASARGALARIAETHFDAVLSDVQMPGASGLELASELRRLSPETRVILMTGFATQEGADAAFRVGAYDYVAKPFALDLAVPAVRRAVAERRRG
jgi:two-component system response regulator PilR (NtrC family)